MTLASLKATVSAHWHKLFTSATLWVSYGMMAWPTLVNNLSTDQTWTQYVPAAWHDKSIAALGALVWLARMRSILPSIKPPAPGP